MRILTIEEKTIEQAEAHIASKAAEFFAELEPLGFELGEVKLPKRLKERFLRVLEVLSSAPEKSFPQLMTENKDLAAFYRLMSNRELTAEKILEPHILATCERADRLRRVLAVHDTSGISYGGQGKRDGLGTLNDGGHGYYLHLSLCVSADGHRLPLGILGYETICRTEPADKTKTWRQKRNDPNKESLRWRRAVQSTEELFEGSGTLLIHVMDREADDYELLDTLLCDEEHFVIRSKYDRLLDLSSLSKDQREEAPRKVREALSQEHVVFERIVNLSPRKKDRSTEKLKTHPPREGRVAKLHGAAARVRIKRPSELAKTEFSPSIELNVVRVWEVDAPEGVVPVEWYLLTTEPIDTVEQILEIVDFYRARWVIEEFFKALKSGCSIEKRQLETKEALLNALAIFLPIAHRLLLLRSLARSAPALPATVVLSDTQVQILRRSRPNDKLPPEPTIRQALLAVAAMGGHLKHNGDPGWQVIGRGFEKIMIIQEYLALNEGVDTFQKSGSDKLLMIKEHLDLQAG